MNARGIHHVTAIVGDVRRAADFYRDVLGLKCVKKTVCYDDPGSYHIYYGDGLGTPGTVLSTLAWNCVTPGLAGVGEVVQTAFRAAPHSLDQWADRLSSFDLPNRAQVSPFGERMLCFADPDGTTLALVEKWKDRRQGAITMRRPIACCSASTMSRSTSARRTQQSISCSGSSASS